MQTFVVKPLDRAGPLTKGSSFYAFEDGSKAVFRTVVL